MLKGKSCIQPGSSTLSSSSSTNVIMSIKMRQMGQDNKLPLWNKKQWVWSCVFIADFDTDSPASWSVFLIWPTVVKGFLRNSILLSTITIVLWGIPVFRCSWAHQCFLSFLRMNQIVDMTTTNVFAFSLMGVFWSFSLMIVFSQAMMVLYWQHEVKREQDSKTKCNTISLL